VEDHVKDQHSEPHGSRRRPSYILDQRGSSPCDKPGEQLEEWEPGGVQLLDVKPSLFQQWTELPWRMVATVSDVLVT
jgi:hypothetical protein